ncbi:tyrosine-protein phosphatase [Streptomyces griseocarneus]|uniref:tyrosine-protein phosphatase n=1 Tax=Streptomyces griseocarneus TaxID=51201 RepID=UPI00167E13CD|nr:tyrosine-protein phosphatase [Streptomyces griseocarneus]MBZ6472089.1 tyrosine-protein phosphatase [Streptomyces griseocarneus]GHG73891.1 phosphotyrosine protein phosphatase [Streptomyces griseocarneus]
MPQQYDASTITNLRDLGGIALAGNSAVRPGLLLRSGRLDRLDPEADPVVAALGIHTVVDLRSEHERRERPDRLPEGARLIVADVLAGLSAHRTGPHQGHAAPGDRVPARLEDVLGSPAAAEEHLGGGKAEKLMCDTYRTFVTSEPACQAYGLLLTTLAEPDCGPLLFHCTAGKDRTGWAAAVVLLLLGADAGAVEREYLAVNPAVRAAFAPVIDRFTAVGGDPSIADAILGVRPVYLEAALEEMHRLHGDVNGYVREGLGIPDAAVDRIRSRCVA